MKMNIKNWLLGGKKEDYRQILKKEGRIPYLEKKVVKLEKMIRGLQSNMDRFAMRLQKKETKKKGAGRNAPI